MLHFRRQRVGQRAREELRELQGQQERQELQRHYKKQTSTSSPGQQKVQVPQKGEPQLRQDGYPQSQTQRPMIVSWLITYTSPCGRTNLAATPASMGIRPHVADASQESQKTLTAAVQPSAESPLALGQNGEPSDYAEQDRSLHLALRRMAEPQRSLTWYAHSLFTQPLLTLSRGCDSTTARAQAHPYIKWTSTSTFEPPSETSSRPNQPFDTAPS
jgi:hypothetical protein